MSKQPRKTMSVASRKKISDSMKASYARRSRTVEITKTFSLEEVHAKHAEFVKGKIVQMADDLQPADRLDLIAKLAKSKVG